MFPSHKKMLDASSGFQSVAGQSRKDTRLKNNWDDSQRDYIFSDAKFEEREKVLEFLLENCPVPRNIKMITMPGERWLFEKMILEKYPDAKFLAVESSWQTLQRSKSYMPDGHLVFHGRQGEYGRSRGLRHGCIDRDWEYGNRSIKGVSVSKRVRALNISLSDLCQFTINTKWDSIEQLEKFNKKFCFNNMAWLDFTGNLSRESKTSIQNIRNLINPNLNCPIAITLFNGRDEFSNTKDRLSFLRNSVERFEIQDHWKYKGMNDSPMITVCGVLRKTREFSCN